MALLRQRADRRSLLCMASYFLLVTLGIVLLHDERLPSWWVLSPLVMFTAFVSFRCAVITHNTIHVPMFHSARLNRVTQILLTLCYGHPVSAFVPGHNLSHHQHTQTSRDLMHTDRLRFRWNLLNQLLFFYVVSGDITRANVEYVRMMRKRSPGWYRQFLLETLVWLGAYAGLAALDWRALVLFVLIPHHSAAWGIVGINFIQHDGCDEYDPLNGARNLTGRTMNFWFFNNGFHTIHHMHPRLHWSLVPAAHAREVAPRCHPNLLQSSFLAYCVKAYVWPGIRMRFDGVPMPRPKPFVSEPWIETLDRRGAS